ncbi:hypothetical protein [Dickeya lacustris]|uniref:Lipoprotein n=1 Tax=Dickeya lacustris TaxID=2259638 RepID=A0ABY8G7T4_9GAMM|nr:hypothetical protein [Dickeya lacustris]WFN56015.1 hypothetical protein O1Q98_01415 [Dickeya lacustris]
MNNFFKIPLIIISALTLSACASNPRIEYLSGEQRSKAINMPVYKNNPLSPNAKTIKAVDGLSCNRNKYQAPDISESEALEGVKIKAAMLNADAVVNTICQKNSDTDWINNCWASVKCIGDAVTIVK